MIDHAFGLPEGRLPVLRMPATPAHTNSGGDIFGGWIMGEVDIAGAIPAVLLAKGRVATVAVSNMRFITPVFVGDMLSLYADIVRVGTSSISVDVDVYAQRNPVAPECVKVAEARLVYVALDANGKPRPIPAQT